MFSHDGEGSSLHACSGKNPRVFRQVGGDIERERPKTVGLTRVYRLMCFVELCMQPSPTGDVW